MAEIATIARPYANAVFALAKQRDELPKWSRTLGLLSAAVSTDQVQALVNTPTLSTEVKAHQLVKVAGEELDLGSRRFVHVLAENGRLDLLGEIASQFEALKANAERTLDVEIAAAVELSAGQRAAFAHALRQRFDQEVQVEAVVDAKLIGGAVVRAGDTVIDGSVRGRLVRLVDALQRG